MWLLAEWPPQSAQATDYWPSDMPKDTDRPELVRLTTIRWRTEHDYRELKTALGPDHFEGRTFTGWHRHVPVVSAAQLLHRLAADQPSKRLLGLSPSTVLSLYTEPGPGGQAGMTEQVVGDHRDRPGLSWCGPG